MTTPSAGRIPLLTPADLERRLTAAATLDEQDDTRRYVTVVRHGSNATGLRPDGAVLTLWVGTVAPSAALIDDLWLDVQTVPAVVRRFDGSSFPAAGASGGGTATDATASVKGVVQLAGDLGGTAAAPTVPGLASKVGTSDSRLTDARVPLAHTQPASSITGLDAAARAAAPVQSVAGRTGAVTLTYADLAGLVPVSALPAIATTETYVVESEAQQLALAAQQGDVAVRNDLARTFILRAAPATTLANWQEILAGSGSAGGSVTSVAGKTGVVTLVKGDVGLGNVDNTGDAVKPVSTPQQTALNLKANLASPALTGTPTAPTPADTDGATRIATKAYVDAKVGTGGGTAGGPYVTQAQYDAADAEPLVLNPTDLRAYGGTGVVSSVFVRGWLPSWSLPADTDAKIGTALALPSTWSVVNVKVRIYLNDATAASNTVLSVATASLGDADTLPAAPTTFSTPVVTPVAAQYVPQVIDLGNHPHTTGPSKRFVVIVRSNGLDASDQRTVASYLTEVILTKASA